MGPGLRHQDRPNQFEPGAGELSLRSIYHWGRRCFSASYRHGSGNDTDKLCRACNGYKRKRLRFPAVSSVVWLRTTQQAGLERCQQLWLRRKHWIPAVRDGADQLYVGLLRPERGVSALCAGNGTKRKRISFLVYAGEHWRVRQPQTTGAAVLTARPAQTGTAIVHNGDDEQCGHARSESRVPAPDPRRARPV